MRNLTAARQVTHTAAEQSGASFGLGRVTDDSGGLLAGRQLHSRVAALGDELSGAALAIGRTATSDGALGEAHLRLVETLEALTRAVADGDMTEEQRQADQLLVDQAIAGINRVGGGERLNGETLLSGADGFSVYAADYGEAGTDYLAALPSIGTTDPAADNFAGASATVAQAMGQVATAEERLSAAQVTALEGQLEALENTWIGVTGSKSMTRDTGYSVALTEDVRARILQNTGRTVLAMAGQVTSGGTLDLLV